MKRNIPDVLIDERVGRMVAAKLGLRPSASGLLGILIRAKKGATIPAVLPLLDRLQTGARFRISPVLRMQIATLSGESTASQEADTP